ncbi:MAG: membrane protein insertase YidC [Spirosomataceae bacterium]
MDRNTVIGMLLIFLMLVGYQLLVPEPEKPEPIKKTVTTKPTLPKQAAPVDTAAVRQAMGDFAQGVVGSSQNIIVENKDIKVTFNTLGGKIEQVELKNYKTFDQKPLYLVDEGSKFTIELPSLKGNVNLNKLFFVTANTNKSLASGQTEQIKFTLALAPGKTVEQTYTIPAEGFKIGYDLKLNGLDAELKNAPAHVLWQKQVHQTEFDPTENRKASTVNYYLADETFDNLSETPTGTQEATLEQGAKWLSFKQKYFVTGFIAKNEPLQQVKVKSIAQPEDSVSLKTLEADFQLSLNDLKAGKGNFELFFGPNKFNVVKEVTDGFWHNVYLGYAFFPSVNRYVFVPLFNFLEGFVTNYGLLIFLLVLIIKTILLPLVYRSFISMAKMRVLQPEINDLKEKVGDDAAKLQQEQMKLYQQVGVSPLSGCVPLLLQLPVLMSVFFLFPNLIELRQQPFLWSVDLSTYDAPIMLPFSIPFYGSHVSIFTLLMGLSNIAYAYYNNQITPTQANSPINMKAMGYITPVIFMFIMNNFPSGLSFYYFVSNLVTIAQQLIIRRFVDEGKIKEVLEENRKKFASGTVKKSKFATMLEKSMQAAEEAKKQQEAQKSTNNKKKK